MNKYIKFGLLI